MRLTRDEMKQKLEEMLSPKRYLHSVNVMKTAAELAEHYGLETDKIAVAGLLHDCARDIKEDEVFQYCTRFNIPVDEVCRKQPELLHGPIGSYIAKTEFGVENEEILSAIYHHTLGYENMTLFDKIILLSDYIEPGRKFNGVDEIRDMAFEDIDEAIITALGQTIQYVIKKGALIHPETVKARNYLIMAKQNVNLEASLR